MSTFEVTGAGITLMSGERQGPICASGPSVAGLELLQFNMAQGPCRDAHHSGRTAHAPQLDASAALRWPPFVELATLRAHARRHNLLLSQVAADITTGSIALAALDPWPRPSVQSDGHERG